MTEIPPHLIELADRLDDALRQARERRKERAAFLQAPPSGFFILPVSKAEQDARHAELECLIEDELKRS